MSCIPRVGLVLTAGDYILAKSVANVFGIIDADAEATMAAIAGSFAGRAAAGLLSFIPGVSAIVAGTTTKGIGEAVINHYKALSHLP